MAEPQSRKHLVKHRQSQECAEWTKDSQMSQQKPGGHKDGKSGNTSNEHVLFSILRVEPGFNHFPEMFPN